MACFCTLVANIHATCFKYYILLALIDEVPGKLLDSLLPSHLLCEQRALDDVEVLVQVMDLNTAVAYTHSRA